MDPLTSIALVTALILAHPSQTRLNSGSMITRRTETSFLVNPPAPIFVDAYNEPVFAELLSYKTFSDGWDGDGSVAPLVSDIEAAMTFVEMLQPYLEAPGALLSSNGQVGLYWNMPMIYIDINFETNGTISIYSRDRSVVPNKESFSENINPKDEEACLMPLLNLLKPMALAA